jgi:hypothetical protein
VVGLRAETALGDSTDLLLFRLKRPEEAHCPLHPLYNIVWISGTVISIKLTKAGSGSYSLGVAIGS